MEDWCVASDEVGRRWLDEVEEVEIVKEADSAFTSATTWPSSTHRSCRRARKHHSEFCLSEDFSGFNSPVFRAGRQYAALEGFSVGHFAFGLSEDFIWHSGTKNELHPLSLTCPIQEIVIDIEFDMSYTRVLHPLSLTLYLSRCLLTCLLFFYWLVWCFTPGAGRGNVTARTVTLSFCELARVTALA